MYDNDPKTMGNKIQTRDKIEPQHILNYHWPTASYKRLASVYQIVKSRLKIEIHIIFINHLVKPVMIILG